MTVKNSQYVRCFWTGSLYLTNGTVMPIQCTHISTKRVEVEAPIGVLGSKLVKLELKAMHEGNKALITIVCDPIADILNERDKHYIRLKFHSLKNKDMKFIQAYIDYKS